MKAVEGKPLPLGVTITDDRINFSIAVPEGRTCSLLLYEAGSCEPCERVPVEQSVGEVHFIALEGMEADAYEYNYMFDERIVVDPYVRALAGRSVWRREYDIQQHEVRGIIQTGTYDWEGDAPLHIPYNEVIAYSLHVRGFTKHSLSKAVHKGTFAGVVEKIPYLTELGINQIHCMPVYEFEECLQYTNYWGYGDGFFFAPKSAYAASGDGIKELKDMVKACHKAGIEVVLEMPFTDKTPKQLMVECLRYYMLEYHMDGFIMNPAVAPMETLSGDPMLKKTKVMRHDMGFQTVMRRFLKGDEGMVGDAIYWLKHNSRQDGIFNSIAAHNGFTLHDLVSYDGKHNEANGENNLDGPDYNYSWNCGAEGPTRKKAVLQLRRRQMRNAFFLLLLAQGTPCILAGDEFANSQKGNNNAYCQDNPTGWLDWGKAERESELFTFVKELIALRKKHPVLYPAKEAEGIDMLCCGMPDVSYHGENAWKIPSEVSSRQLGVYYYGAYADDEDCFVIYNMHWLPHTFALPSLPKDKKWHAAASTKDGILAEYRLLENQRLIEAEERTVIMLTGR
ncbi:alpha-amylase family glycosyl hydrolase [Extibacter muris]|uniref:Glycogen debranching protein n=1 Tax=Extibacter muris TaxID=1796622 RepID=A0A4R4FJC9_9FIRM|nr:alpha-amylase family glycosyl hydrolase [Extibacter muris]MCU0078672.1 alpha-amylase family glycosyl hydrolase [Extibacter muris]TDA22939.1 glycogen debranching protein [Extibacter muris]